MKEELSINNSQLSYKSVNTNHKINTNCIFVSLIYTSSMAGNIVAYTPSQDTNREK